MKRITKMNALIFFCMTVSFILWQMAGWSCAKRHYKTYKGEQPLYIIYGILAAIVWGTIMIYALEYLHIIKPYE